MRKRWLSTLRTLAIQDPRLIFIGSDLSADPAIKTFQKELGPRFFMEGVSEAHIVGMASGLAMNGYIVYVNTIATFLSRRCFEQNVIDLGLANVPVRLIAGGGGLVYAPLGPTHLAIDDIGIMRTIPNMSIVVPCDADEMERAIVQTVNHPGPIYFRVAKGGETVVSRSQLGFELGKAIVCRPGNDILIVTTGVLLSLALDAADELEKMGHRVGVVHVHTVKPLDTACLSNLIRGAKRVLTLEEHLITGGLGSAVAELIAESSYQRKPEFKRLGLPDEFPDEYGSQESLLLKYGISIPGIISNALNSTP